MKHTLIAALFVASNLMSSLARAQEADFNEYILEAVQMIASERSRGGYDINHYFTQPINYGEHCCLRHKGGTETMCVAAVMEVILEAMNIYRSETGSNSAHSSVPLVSWSRGTPTSLRASIFMYAGTGSRGTAHTLERFGLGTQLSFSELKPGDFVNFNRTSGSGHAVVFIGYIYEDGVITNSYSPNAVGFRYFSAQGKGKPDAGFAYRNAYFSGMCPQATVGIRRDCGIIRSERQVLLNTGRMFHPNHWNYEAAVSEMEDQIKDDLIRDLSGQQVLNFGPSLQSFLEEELEPVFYKDGVFDGETLD